jgi:WhiB family redox-sensing transcriptional regulator
VTLIEATADEHAWRGDPAEIVAGLDDEAVRAWVRRLIGYRPAWTAAAACAGTATDLFFPGPGPGQARAALAVCSTCPVIDECRRWAFETEKHGWETGVLGGYTASQRRDIRARARGLPDREARRAAIR